MALGPQAWGAGPRPCSSPPGPSEGRAAAPRAPGAAAPPPPRGLRAMGRGAGGGRGWRRLAAGPGAWRAGVAGVGTLVGTVSLTFATFYAVGRSPMDVCRDSEWTKRYGCNPRTLPPISYTFNHLPERYIALPGCLLAGLFMSYFYLGFYSELGQELQSVPDVPARWGAILRWAHRAGHLASAGLVVTAAVSMKMHSMGHAMIAFLFFICGIAHIFLAFRLQQLLARRPRAPDRLFAPRSVAVKKVVLILIRCSSPSWCATRPCRAERFCRSCSRRPSGGPSRPASSRTFPS